MRTHATPCQYQGSGERARTAQSEKFECSRQTHLLTGYHAGQLVATPPLASKPVCTHAQAPVARGVICQTHFLHSQRDVLGGGAPTSCLSSPAHLLSVEIVGPAIDSTYT